MGLTVSVNKLTLNAPYQQVDKMPAAVPFFLLAFTMPNSQCEQAYTKHTLSLDFDQQVDKVPAAVPFLLFIVCTSRDVGLLAEVLIMHHLHDWASSLDDRLGSLLCQVGACFDIWAGHIHTLLHVRSCCVSCL